MKSLIKAAVQEVLEAEMTELLGAGPHERQEGRQGYRAGYYERGLVTRIGKLESYPYLILDARYEKVREEGVIRSRAVLIAIGIHEGGRREVLAVDLAPRESQSSWKDFLVRLKDRGLYGVEFVVSDDHAGLKKPSPRC